MTIFAFLAGLLPQPQLGILGAVLAWLGLDWLIGALAALKTSTFSFRVLGDQLKKIALTVGGLLVLELTTTSLFGSTGAATTGTFVAAAMAAIASTTADLFQKVGFVLGNAAAAIPARTVTSVLAPQEPLPPVLDTNLNLPAVNAAPVDVPAATPTPAS